MAREGFNGEFAVDFAQEHEIAPYRTYCRTSPESVVRIIRDLHQQTTPDENFFAALAAAGEFVKGEIPSQANVAVWYRLVDAGIVDALVDSILASNALVMEFPPETPEHIRKRAQLEVSVSGENCASCLSVDHATCRQLRHIIMLWRHSPTRRDLRRWEHPGRRIKL